MSDSSRPHGPQRTRLPVLSRASNYSSGGCFSVSRANLLSTGSKLQTPTLSLHSRFCTPPTLNPCAHSGRSELLKNHSRDFTNLIIIAWYNGNEENKEGVEITHDSGAYSLIREWKDHLLKVGTFHR